MSDIDRTLQALGFTAGNDGVLRAPAGSWVELNPGGAQFYELRITLAGGNPVVTVVVPKVAVKIEKSGTSSPALISDR